VLDHRWDLAADFRAIYRLSPAEAMALPGPEYFALCWRVPAYQGVMQLRLEQERENEEKAQGEVTPTRAAIESTPAAAGLIDWGGA
jgi:hypothetical protein